jgi:hypothetical protein
MASACAKTGDAVATNVSAPTIAAMRAEDENFTEFRSIGWSAFGRDGEQVEQRTVPRV